MRTLPRIAQNTCLLAACASALLACSGSDGSRLVVRDSAGIQIVENASRDSADHVWWRLSPRPDIDIGAAEGNEAETLFRVTDVKRLGDGRVVVANSGPPQVRFYRTDGTPDVATGKPGSGPGEFQRIAELTVLPGDTVVVLDPAARRLTLLDAQGRFVRNVGSNLGLRTVLGRDPSGVWIAVVPAPMGAPSTLSGTIRSELLIARVSSAGNVTDTIARFPGNEQHVRVRQAGGQITSVEVFGFPFARRSTVRLHDDALIIGTQDGPELREYGRAGVLRRIIRTASALTPVTQDHVDRVIERQVAGLPDERASAVRQSMRELTSAKFLPPYGTFLIDRTAKLWLQDFPALHDGQRWSVFDPQGRLIARVALPDRFTPFDIGADWIAGKELDELDVEHVRVYRIVTDHR